MVKVSKYNNLCFYESDLFVFNPCANAAVRISDPSLASLVKTWKQEELIDEGNYPEDFIQSMLDKGVLVDINRDELDYVNYIYSQYLRPVKLSIIILATRNCNFNCPYCYEKHEDKTMNRDIYSGIIEFIRNKKKEGYSMLEIGWFGGEPLLEYDDICWFMEQLQYNFPDMSITGNMTTNGYLLSVERLNNLTKHLVKHYQITIDGLRDTHNKTRILKNGNGTWDTVFNNLIQASKTDIDFSIGIRTNFTEEMHPLYEKWFDLIKCNFGKDSRFAVHFEAVKNLGIANDYAVFRNSTTDDILSEMGKASIKLELETPIISMLTKPCGAICYAASPHNYLIDYDGTIRKCTVALDDKKNIIGHLGKEGIIDFDLRNFAWWVNYEVYEECKKCSIYPVCFGRKCPNVYFNEQGCNTIKTMYKVGMEKIIHKYYHFLKSQAVNNEA